MLLSKINVSIQQVIDVIMVQSAFKFGQEVKTTNNIENINAF